MMRDKCKAGGWQDVVASDQASENMKHADKPVKAMALANEIFQTCPEVATTF